MISDGAISDVRERLNRDAVVCGLDEFHQVGEGADAEAARKLARDGNPFPLVGVQWPELLVTEPEEVVFFEGSIGDPLNPCLRIDPWQRQVLAASFDVTVGEIAMKGCTGAGKGAISAMVANLLFDVYNPCRINVTSETFRHASKNLFGEILKWRDRMDCPSSGNALSTEITDTERHYVTILNPSAYGKGEAFSGAHSEMTVYFFDEASAIPEVHYTNALKNGGKFFMLSNPRITEGWFRDLYKPLRGSGTKEEQNRLENETGYCAGRKGRRLCVTIPGDACANVRYGRLKLPVAPSRGITIDGHEYGPAERISEEHYKKVSALVPEQIDLEQYQSIIDKSKESWEVECYAHARFPSENPIRQVILHSWLPRHTDYFKQTGVSVEVTSFGLDVSRSLSGDETVLAAGGEQGVKALHKWNSRDNMDHVRRIIRIAWDEYGIDLREGQNPVYVDMGGGYGGGVLDRLRELEVWAVEFMPNGRPVVSPGLYTNIRTEWYMLLGRRLDPSDNWQMHPWALPEDNLLLEELTAPVKMPKGGGVSWAIEPKADIQSRLGRSPDSADAIVCLYRAVFERHGLLKQLELQTPRDSYYDDDENESLVDELPEDEAVGLFDPHRAPGLPPAEPERILSKDLPEPPIPMTEGEKVDSVTSWLDDLIAAPHQEHKTKPRGRRRYLIDDDDDDEFYSP